MFRKLFYIPLLLLFVLQSNAQISLNSGSVDYNKQKEYEIGGITVSGVKYLDHEVLINLSGLNIGDKILIPGDEKISDAIKKLWKQNLFSDVEISIEKIIGENIFLNIYLLERPRLSKFSFEGIKKGEAEDIREMIKLVKGNQITDNVINNTKNIIRNYFFDKGYYKTQVEIIKEDDTTLVNTVSLKIKINKNEKIKINQIEFYGNNVLSSNKLRRSMKDTKQKTWYNIFKTSKFVTKDYKDDKNKLIKKYNEHGFRDAVILKDSVFDNDSKTLNILIKLEEGKKYYFRNITWVGNTKYKSDYLTSLLGIKKGEVYNQTLLEESIFMNQDGVFSKYQDNGYLFSSITPVETNVENDSIDIEIRIYEGKPAKVRNVTIVGNTKTNEHVIRREIRSMPGQLYNRSDITRSIRELATLGYFDPEKLNLNPTPNPEDGTVDLEYVVEEKPSDQVELSGGWGANMIVGTLGISFNNFSARHFFDRRSWRPLPAGDGQRLSLRAQSNGLWYQAYNMSFVEPWLGGKKPNSLTVSLSHTILSNGVKKSDIDTLTGISNRQSMKITGAALGLGRRLKWPDDFFTLYNEFSFQHYDMNNYKYQNLFKEFNNGTANNFSFTTIFGRNSIDQPIYPRRGSSFSLSLQITPPYSLLSSKDYSTLSEEEKYKYIEYNKWKFNSTWVTSLAGKLVLSTRAEFGFLGRWSKAYGYSPFEGFNLGGDGLVTYNLQGMETIALRGYENGSLTPDAGGNVYDKFTVELRYPLSLNPSATLYGLTFVEAGKAWSEFHDFNPFSVHRSAGVGVRIFLPMFGKLGVDWGYGFDEVPGNPNAHKSQFHFIIGQNF